MRRRKDYGRVKPSDWLLFAIPLLLVVFMFRAQRKRQSSLSDLQSRLAPGQQILTTAGLYAEIVSLDDAVMVLKTGPGQTVRWDRRAVASIVPVAQTLTESRTDGLSDGPNTPINEK